MKAYKINNKNGYSLVEVLVSIVLIALLATMIAAFLLFWQKIREQSNNLTIALNDAQRTIEIEYNTLRKKIINKPKDTIEIDGYSSVVYKDVFRTGQNIIVYKISSLDDPAAETGSINKDEIIKLYGGLADTYRSQPKIPQITKVLIKSNDTAIRAVYFAESGNYLSVDKNSIKGDIANLKKYIYQWYMGSNAFHTLPLYGEKMGELSGVTAVCPQDFNLISGEQAIDLPEISKYKGKLLTCMVTPGSIEGYMGNSLCSNYYYISELPAINDKENKYFALFDASLITDNPALDVSGGQTPVYPYDNIEIIAKDGEAGNPIKVIALNELRSELKSASSKLSHTGTVYLNVEGDETASGYMTRSLYYTSGVKSTMTPITAGEVQVFAIARDRKKSGGAFIKDAAGNPYLGFTADENGALIDTWQLVQNKITLSGNTAFIVGDMNVDIAELIVVKNPSADDVSSITNYLNKKYFGIVP